MSSATKREFFLLLFLVFFTAAAVIWIRTATVRDTYRFVQSEKDFRKLQQDTQVLRVQWLKMTSPRRLKGLADTLGLFPPKIHQIVKLANKKTQGHHR